MSIRESSHKSLLQGVSQQIPRERRQGQVTAQENMLSDAVTNLRRRPGAQYAFNQTMTGATKDTILAWYTDIAGANVHVILNTINGTVKLLDDTYTVLATLAGGAYLTTDTKNIRTATIGDEFFLLNKAATISVTAPAASVSPARRGFFYIASGAFNKTFEVTVATNSGTITAAYTTPTGAGAGDAALSTATYIAGQLTATLVASMASIGITTVNNVEAYVYIEGNTGVTSTVVNSSTGSAFVVVSKDSYVPTEGNLPAKLPTGADTYIMRVGDIRLPKYYKYSYASTAWLECGVYGSPAGITGMPISITKVAGTWSIVTSAFEGRFAGDDESNPSPHFLTRGITGLAVYQGRLVILSGATVLLSAANKPRRFYRSTVTSVLDSDTISVSASANSSAAYEYGVGFQKDLILFSAKYQALIPSGNTAITPKNATVVLTSTNAADMGSPPIVTGRTLMYTAPRSSSFFGVLEMVPSQYTDSQYISEDATPHLPKYLAGQCRFGVSSSVSNMALFSPSADKYSLIVHEYLWEGDKKVQQAWHRWTFKYEVAAVYFANASVYVLFAQNNTVVGCTIDPRIGLLTVAGTQRPFLDLYSTVSIVANVVTLPAWLLAFDPAAPAAVDLTVGTGALAGEKVGFTVVGPVLHTVRSYPSGDVALGVNFTSALSPTPPQVKDRNEVVISTSPATILRYIVSVSNSSEYKVVVRDVNTATPDTISVGVLYWSSAELDMGKALNSLESNAVVPCRTSAPTTTLLLYTGGTGELNITAIEYVLKHHQKIKRGYSATEF